MSEAFPRIVLELMVMSRVPHERDGDAAPNASSEPALFDQRFVDFRREPLEHLELESLLSAFSKVLRFRDEP